MLHPRRSAQEVLLCDLCETVPLQSHCELCNINLCVSCVGKHLSDSSKLHNVRPYLQKKFTPNYPRCPKHVGKHCELYCKKCDIPVCYICVSSGKHKGHDISDITDIIIAKTLTLQNDLKELETTIFPRYEEMTSDILNKKAQLHANYLTLITDADQQGEILHQAVTAIVNQRKSDIQEMKNKHLSTLNKNAEEITHKITELKQIISDLKAMLKSYDVSLTSTYKSRNPEYTTLPHKVRIALPSFSPGKINKDQLNQMFGSLSPLSINTEHGETMESQEAVSSPPVKPMTSPEAVSSPPVKPMKSPEAASFPPVKPKKSPEAVSSSPIKLLLLEQRLIATTDTGYDGLYSISCLSEEKFWTCGNNEIMKLLNVQGKLLSSMQTKSGNWPGDIAVTRSGVLIYTDPNDKTINQVKNKKIRTVITLQGWAPLNVYSTATDDLLVTMISADGEQCKVVRYSGSTEKQTIQFDDQALPLYSSAGCISENRNLDICVADNKASAVVVVNQSGKLRFRYAGHPSNVDESFYPYGIATDSQSHILTADYWNDDIHILDQDGQFLCYIHNWDLDSPRGLCVDIRDNIFVAESVTAKVKKIQYL